MEKKHEKIAFLKQKNVGISGIPAGENHPQLRAFHFQTIRPVVDHWLVCLVARHRGPTALAATLATRRNLVRHGTWTLWGSVGPFKRSFVFWFYLLPKQLSRQFWIWQPIGNAQWELSVVMLVSDFRSPAAPLAGFSPNCCWSVSYLVSWGRSQQMAFSVLREAARRRFSTAKHKIPYPAQRCVVLLA